MFPKVNPTTTAAWAALTAHYNEIKKTPMKDLFKEDPKRFSKYSLTQGDILFDFSKNIISDKTLELLFQLAKECQLQDAIKAMFNGEKINVTENRAVLHTALRAPAGASVMVDGQNVVPQVQEVLRRMADFSGQVRLDVLPGL